MTGFLNSGFGFLLALVLIEGSVALAVRWVRCRRRYVFERVARRSVLRGQRWLDEHEEREYRARIRIESEMLAMIAVAEGPSREEIYAACGLPVPS